MNKLKLIEINALILVMAIFLFSLSSKSFASECGGSIGVGGSSGQCNTYACSDANGCTYNPNADVSAVTTRKCGSIGSCHIITQCFCQYSVDYYSGNCCGGSGGYIPPACETNSTYNLKVTVKNTENIVNSCHVGEEDYEQTSIGNLNLGISSVELDKNKWWSKLNNSQDFGGAYGGDDTETTPTGNIALGWDPVRGKYWGTPGVTGAGDIDTTSVGYLYLGWYYPPSLGVGWKDIPLNTTAISSMVGYSPSFENNGFLLMCSGEVMNNSLFASREYPTASIRPKLTVSYTTSSNPTPTTVVLNPTADATIAAGLVIAGTNWVRQYSNNNYGSDGSISVGETQPFRPPAGGDNPTRGLIKFDLSTIPSGATIVSATLSLYRYGSQNVSYSQPCGLTAYRIRLPWVENQVTWNLYSTVNWITIPLSTTAISSMVGNSPSFENNGFLLKCANEVMNNSQFYSREYIGDPSLRPKLTVVYSTPTNTTDTTTVLIPVADTYIIAGDMVAGTDWERQSSTSNFGHSTAISVGDTQQFATPSSPPGAYNPSRGLIKFDLSAIPSNATIKSAKLSLYLYGTANVTYTMPCDLGAYRFKRGWEEYYTTWNVHGYNWRIIDLDTSAVKEMLGGSPTFANNGFIVKSDKERSDLYNYYSREYGTGSELGPKIKIIYSTPSSEDTLTTLSASADTSILSSSTAANYGNDATLNIGNGIVSDNFTTGRGLVKFNLSALPSNADIISAKLALYLYDGSASKDSVLKVYRLRREWVESQATWKVYSTGNLWWCGNSLGWTCGEREAVVGGSKVYAYAITNGELGAALTGSPATADANGLVTFSDISTAKNVLALTADKIQDLDSLQLVCPSTQITRIDLGTVDYCSTKTVLLGIGNGTSILNNLSWLTVIDGDIFSSAVETAVPAGSGAGGFSLSLINSKVDTNQGIGGYLFTKGYISTGNDRLYESDLGGSVFEIASNSLLSHDDVSLIKLQKRAFAPPTHNEVTELSNINTFEAGRIYKVSVSDFNSKLAEGPVTYTVSQSTDPNLAAAGVYTAILYITGDDDVVFSNSFQSSNPSYARLIIVTNAKVVISKDVGFSNIAAYTVTASPLIQAGIITSKEILIESKETSPASDTPLMVSSPLISMSAITSNRNIGVYNDRLPALSVSYYPKFLYDLAIIERLQSYSGSRSYTGLNTYDLQFDYQY